MTQTSFSSPRLERPRDSAFKGVCTAIARTTGTDPVLWRVLALGLTFFGGLGVVLYLIGIVAIPAEGQPLSLAERVLKGPDRRVSTSQSLLLALVVLMIGGFLLDDHDDGLLVGAVVGALAILWWRERSDRPAPIRSTVDSGPSSTVVDSVPSSTVVDSVPSSPSPAWNPPPPRPRSPLVGLTVSATVLVAGALLLVGATDVASIPLEVILAASLATVGVGLVAGSFFGRAPALVALAVLIAAALGITAGARPALAGGIGERYWTPVTVASYRLGLGEATLDLSSMPDQAATITARVDVGYLLVIVPADLRVAVDARAGLGEVKLFGVEYGGPRVDRHVKTGPPGSPLITLDLSVRTGLVEVRHG